MTTDYTKMTVAELIERYQEFKRPVWTSTPNGKSNADTWEVQSRGVVKFFGAKTLGELCEGDELRNLCQQYAASKDLKPGSVRKQLQCLTSPLYWAWRQRWITGRPLAWLPPADDARERQVSDEEVESLLDTVGAYPTEHHTKVFTYLAVFTPAQKYAILQLSWDQVDFNKGTITFSGRAHQKRQKVAMHPRLRDVLQHAASVRDPKCKHVISWNGKPVNQVYPAFKRALLRAGLDDVTMNDLRKWNPDHDPAEESADERDQEGRLVISYCTKDGMLVAAALCLELEARGQLCWIAPRNIGAGVYSGQIMTAIEDGGGLIVVLTRKANESRHVLQEVNAAHDLGKVIVPVIVDDTQPSTDLRYYLATSQQVRWSDAPGTAASVLTLLSRRSDRAH